MAIAFKTALGNNVSQASGTSLVITLSAAIAVDDLVIVRVAADNLSATTPTITCVDSDGVNSYVQHAFRGQNATAAAGVVGAIFGCRATDAVSAGGTITLTFSGSVVAKAAYAESFTGAANYSEITVLQAGGSSASPSSGASASVSSGSLVVGFGAIEGNGSVTADGDTSNGSWSSQVTVNSAAGGTSNTRVQAVGQYKITTGAGAQTYNLTITSTDWNAFLVAFPVYTAPGSVSDPVSVSSHFSEGFGGSGIAHTTGSFTPATGELLVCISTVEHQNNSTPSSSVTNTGFTCSTWVKRVTVGPASQTGGSGYYASQEIWVARVTSGGASGTVTHNWTSPSSNWASVSHFFRVASGYDTNVAATSSPTGATGSVQGTTNPTVTMSATPAATSCVVAGCMAWDAGTTAPITVPAAFTQLQDNNWNGTWDSRSKVAYRNNGGNTASHQWTVAAAGNTSATALEIPQAGGAGSVSGTINTAWSGWTGTAAGLVEHPATVATAFSGWTATAAGLVSHAGTVDTAWAGWTATATATVEHAATVSTAWGGWTGTAAGTVTPPGPVDHPGTVSTAWAGWTAEATAVVSHTASIDTAWAGWTAVATGTVTAEEITGTISTAWGGWTGTATALVEHPATVSSSWAGWTATAAGTVSHVGTVSTAWAGWTATATATVTHAATVATAWSGWTATAVATVTHPATISTAWAGWTGLATGTVPGRGLIDTAWAGWTGTATGTRTTFGAISTAWAGWTGLATGTRSTAGTISTAWGGWTATAQGLVTKEWAGSISTAWAGWVGSASATIEHHASISTAWAGWTAIAVGEGANVPLESYWEGQLHVAIQYEDRQIIEWMLTPP